MTLPPNDALKELRDIRKKLEETNDKQYSFFKKRQKGKEIRKLVVMLDVILLSSDPKYIKGDLINNAPKPTPIRFMDVEQEMEASSKTWYQYLSDQLDIYEKRFQLLEKNPPIKSAKIMNKGTTIENVGQYINYNPVVNITTITQNIDHIIYELEKETTLDSKTKEEIKSKLQQVKEIMKNVANEAAPIVGTIIGSTLRQFLTGNEK